MTTTSRGGFAEDMPSITSSSGNSSTEVGRGVVMSTSSGVRVTVTGSSSPGPAGSASPPLITIVPAPVHDDTPPRVNRF